MSDPTTYTSPLVTRYASPAMTRLWSTANRARIWRRLWIVLAESQRELGLDIPDKALAQMRQHLDDVDLDAVREYERRLRHDVMAHIHHFGDQAPAARPFLHLGATSAFVTDNAELLIMREALRLVLARIGTTLGGLAGFAERHAGLPTVAYTHFQPAQLTTVGKRATLWMQDLVLDAEQIRALIDHLPFRGCKGTTGTQASYLDLFGGDHARVQELDRRVAEAFEFSRTIPVSGQTYTRKLDSQVLDALGQVAQSAAKFSTDLRLLQHEQEVFEPMESEQVGSSAMPYKRNPMRSERIGGLARYVLAQLDNAHYTAATQWLERTLDDSANRRVALPEAFLATDAVLVLTTNVAVGMTVNESVVGRHVAQVMPFMATERWLMVGVQAGGDRQTLHEVIRRHSRAVADDVAAGQPNTLLERLASDAAFAHVDAARLRAELDPKRYVGRAAEQVAEFLSGPYADLRDVLSQLPPPDLVEVTV